MRYLRILARMNFRSLIRAKKSDHATDAIRAEWLWDKPSKGSHSNRLSLEIFILYAAASAATVLSRGLSIAASTERGTPAL